MNFLVKLFGKSWKTSASGYTAGLAMIFDTLSVFMQTWEFAVLDFRAIFAGVGLIIMAYNSRDKGVSSEAEGAK